MRLKPHLYIKDGQINSLNFVYILRKAQKNKNPKKIMQDIPVAVTHEWINFKKPEPKITEFFELMFLLDKEYQKNDSQQIEQCHRDYCDVSTTAIVPSETYNSNLAINCYTGDFEIRATSLPY
ncbi:10405_t:CDS:2 [Entrophospora sp. SA101]|nr:8207_t:CDS:2 [Entrophospora sp. SA101]CAJ0745944.1 10405_t:CDS:2 [Entrophospora sp. SA101]CAJ0908875.1 11138_t:CDS:2 [Entrophospora sp. SA101]